MNNHDSYLHTRGESIFVDDFQIPEKLVFASVFTSTIACGKIIHLDIKQAEKAEGVIKILTFKDIPGENQIGGIIPDEPLLAESEVHYYGQPIAIIIAKTSLAARKAQRYIKIKYKKHNPVFDPREAFKKDSLIIPPRIFSLGDIDKAWEKCDIIEEGIAQTGGQEHVYLETQSAIAFPGEKLKIISSTQSPTVVQKTIARVLGKKMNEIEVDVLRLGGGFGGKEDQATPWACMVALASALLNKPVKIILKRSEDMRITGKRHPYSSDFKIGLDKDGKILAYEVTYYQNAGASADLSTAILERTMFHSTNSYFIPNVRAKGISCRTNLPPFTAFRGFGGPQAMFVLEAAIHKAALKMGIDPMIIQKRNLISEGDRFPYGMVVKNPKAKECWDTLEKKYDILKIKESVKIFNSENKVYKKGFAIMPICFGISFTNTMMNQASALVHVYTDGSVGISTAAVEMGQGVNMKILQTSARTFSISENRIRIESTNTSRIANTSPTAASTGADLNGKAVKIACEEILQRMKKYIAGEIGISETSDIQLNDEQFYLKGKKIDYDWRKVITEMNLKRISLSTHAHYATPDIYFDRKIEKGNPFAYHVFGAAIIEITLNTMLGEFKIDSVKVVHDFGVSVNQLIDKGQAEGAILQGLSWMSLEELIYNKDGRLLSDSMTTYKVPDVFYTPESIEIHFLENADNPFGLLNSKAIGEPPFMYGIGLYFAILNAMKEFNPSLEMNYNAPLTNEKILLTLYKNK